MPTPLRIAPIALDSTHRMVLKVAVDLVNDEDIPCELLADDDLSAQLLVIDTDNEHGRRLLADAGDEQLRIVIGSQPLHGRNIVWHEPPVRVHDLKELLIEVCTPLLATPNAADPHRETPVAEADAQVTQPPTVPDTNTQTTDRRADTANDTAGHSATPETATHDTPAPRLVADRDGTGADTAATSRPAAVASRDTASAVPPLPTQAAAPLHRPPSRPAAGIAAQTFPADGQSSIEDFIAELPSANRPSAEPLTEKARLRAVATATAAAPANRDTPPDTAGDAPTEHHAPATPAPAASLFLTLLQARQDKTCFQIQHHQQRLLIGGHNGTIAQAHDTDGKALLSAPFAALQVEQIDAVAFDQASQGLQISALDNLLWQAGVDHSDGRLLDGHRMDQPVRLKAWPNFTRNGFRQSHFKLAAIMARQPVSLQALAAESGVSQAEIISFYNAACAVGLIDRDAPDNRPAAPQPQPRNRRRSLLGKLARKLGFR